MAVVDNEFIDYQVSQAFVRNRYIEAAAGIEYITVEIDTLGKTEITEYQRNPE
jgi:hypothetical protein